MRKNLPASLDVPMQNRPLEKRARVFRFPRAVLCFLYGLLFISRSLPAQSWYISNASGQALYPAPSRIVALRNDYCLGMSIISETMLPPELIAYYRPSYKIDCRTLYEKGAPIRRQWVFRNDGGGSRLTAGAGIRDGSPVLAFIERYNENDALIEERQFSEDEQSRTMYFYENALLVRSETEVKTLFTMRPVETEKPDAGAESGENPPAQQPAAVRPADAPDEPQREWRETSFWTDYYRYSRSQSLRNVQRVFRSGGLQTPVISFPQITPHTEFDKAFVSPKAAYNSAFLNDALSGTPIPDVMYTTDAKGRVLAENHYDETGVLIGGVTNTWVRDRIASVAWRSFDADGSVLEERLIEYGYDAKDNRVMERNYVNGVLERSVRTEGGQETEELYMDGRVVLRTFWKDGVKIKEDRMRGK
ncbi:MAG: hypothetical protein LBB61_01575 [Treponema sp.]|jgi:antitoxin component YwqK of YwqJK toxin-antitoxin module|nr:hypothetical protein [Treponema sp.]